MVAALKSLIEPIMIVFLAVIVGGILLAVMVPMFSMYDQIM
jgi:type IV pilus assembly protein PilC